MSDLHRQDIPMRKLTIFFKKNSIIIISYAEQAASCSICIILLNVKTTKLTAT